MEEAAPPDRAQLLVKEGYVSDHLVERLDQRGFRVAHVSEANFAELLKTRAWLEEAVGR